MSLLVVEELVAGYGSHTVLHGVAFEVSEGEAVAMLGLNGAGKSVTLRCVTGILPAWSGRITLDGKDITGASAEARTRLGIATVPQGRGIFPDLSVEQNLRLGGYRLPARTYRERREELLARFPVLAERAEQRAGTLSGGEQAVLAVNRALLSKPRLLILDEPTAGLSPAATATLLSLLTGLRDAGTTLLVVEQNVGFALTIAHRALLMQKGRVIQEASPDKLGDRRALLAALGAGELSKPARRRAPAKTAKGAAGAAKAAAG
ncbi:MAG TPA: ABC transporter ATP-binding protein [Acidimicrobiales bacterium]|nr:ABC transporter ATP-binding protein [Acidimicrobiales bacterium]